MARSEQSSKENTAARERWFVSDRAIQDKDEDLFDHNDVADQLADIVRTISAPATVGLLGSFGVGKSSVGRMLEKRLAGDPRRLTVRISAEKHSGVARQRALIYSVAEGLIDAGIDRDAVEEKLLPLRQSKQVVRIDPAEIGLAKLPWRRIVAVLSTVLVLTYLVGVAIAWLADVDGSVWKWPLVTTWAVLSVVALAFAAVSSVVLPAIQRWLTDSVKPADITEAEPRAEAADEFERAFADLVGVVDKQLIIVVDDIDRLGPDEVLEALQTLKTFESVPESNPPIFVVACDEAIVHSAVRHAATQHSLTAEPGAADELARAYLDKLFKVRQPMPPHLEVDIRAFASDVLTREGPHAGARALGDALDSVLDVLIYEAVHDPRHAIRLVNTFFGDYRLATRRESAGTRLGERVVTEHPEVLARLAVIKADFPVTYARVVANPDLLRVLSAASVGEDGSGADEEALRAVWTVDDDTAPATPTDRERHLLERFLSRTARHVRRVDDLAPFIYLGQDTAGRVLGSEIAQRIRSALLNARSDELEAIVGGIDDADGAAVIDAVRSTLRNARSKLELANAIETSATGLRSASQLDGLADDLATAAVRDSQLDIGPGALWLIIRSCSASYRPVLLGRLATFDEDEAEDRRADRADAVAAHIAEFGPSPETSEAASVHAEWLAEEASWPTAARWVGTVAGLPEPERQRIAQSEFLAAVLTAALGAESVDETTAGELATVASEVTEPSRAVKDAVRGGLGSENPEAVRLALATVESNSSAAPARSLELWTLATAVERHDEVPLTDEVIRRVGAVLADGAAGNVKIGEESEAVAPKLGIALTASAVSNATTVASTVPMLAARHPEEVPAVAEALAEVLDDHRQPGDAVGLAVAEGLISALDELSEHADPLVDILTRPIEPGPVTEERRFALDLLPRVLSTKGGSEARNRLGDRWLQVFASAPGDDNLMPVAEAMGTLWEVDREEAERLAPQAIDRMLQLANQGRPGARNAIVTLPWPEAQQPQALAAVGAFLAEVSDRSGTRFLQNAERWVPDGAPSELSGPLRSWVLDPTRSGDVRSQFGTALRLMQPSDQAAAVVEALRIDGMATAEQLADLDAKTLAEAAAGAIEQSALRDLLEVSPDGPLADAAADAMRYCVDHATSATDEDLALLAEGTAQDTGLGADFVERLTEADEDALRSARALDALLDAGREVSTSGLQAAIAARLRDVKSEPLAESLGKLTSRNGSNSSIDDAVKAARREKESKHLATAFDRGLRATK